MGNTPIPSILGTSTVTGAISDLTTLQLIANISANTYTTMGDALKYLATIVGPYSTSIKMGMYITFGSNRTMYRASGTAGLYTYLDCDNNSSVILIRSFYLSSTAPKAIYYMISSNGLSASDQTSSKQSNEIRLYSLAISNNF